MRWNKATATASDAELVAYLDGELSPNDSVRIGQQIAADPAMAARLDRLMKGMRPFREAFDPLLAEAPAERLDGMLDRILEETARPSPRRFGGFGRYWPAAAAAAVVCMLAGSGIDRLVVMPLGQAMLAKAPRADSSDDWRRAVAQYLSLYTSDTLAMIPDLATVRQQELARVGSRLGVDLTPARVDLPDLALKRADLYDYDGKVLAFLAYLDPRSGPVALCIIGGLDHDAAPEVERRRGMNVVYWAQAHHGFMLIGRAGADRLQALAETVTEQFRGGGKPSDDHG